MGCVNEVRNGRSGHDSRGKDIIDLLSLLLDSTLSNLTLHYSHELALSFRNALGVNPFTGSGLSYGTLGVIRRGRAGSKPVRRSQSCVGGFCSGCE